MKYKLINTKTKEETLCNKVTIDGFDYYVSDSFLRINDYGYWEDSSTISQISDITAVLPETKKVIATNNPNIDIPKVVDEIDAILGSYTDILAEKEEVKEAVEIGLKLGYKTSQETHPFSEEDMMGFTNWVWRAEDKDVKIYFNKSTKELLQIWKEQQPKIVYYE